MKGKQQYILIGAAVGAALGAVGGWLYVRKKEPGAGLPVKLDKSKMFQVGMGLVGLIRQLVEL